MIINKWLRNRGSPDDRPATREATSVVRAALWSEWRDRHRRDRLRRLGGFAAATLGMVLLATGCGRGAGPSASSSSAAVTPSTAAAAPTSAPIPAVAAENEYADVVSQIGGPYVQVAAIESDPNTDPHTFEASAAVAKEMAAARLVVVNGLGYDDWAQKMLSASPNAARRVIDVQTLRQLPDSTANPHLWYDPKTMPAVARQVAADLSAIAPGHAAAFQQNVSTFDASLQPWTAALAAFKAKYGGTAVAVTEPVGDDLLQAAGCNIATPWGFQAAVMNGIDPSPQEVTAQQNLFKQHQVKVFLYNQQVTDSLTTSLQAVANQEGVPIVGVYETMPTGYTYQSWMLAETQALERAVAEHTSTTKL